MKSDSSEFLMTEKLDRVINNTLNLLKMQITV